MREPKPEDDAQEYQIPPTRFLMSVAACTRERKHVHKVKWSYWAAQLPAYNFMSVDPHMCICICVYVWMWYACMNCVYVHVWISMYVLVRYVWSCVWSVCTSDPNERMFVCMHAYIYVYVYACIHIYALTHTCIWWISTQICIETNWFSNMHASHDRPTSNKTHSTHSGESTLCSVCAVRMLRLFLSYLTMMSTPRWCDARSFVCASLRILCIYVCVYVYVYLYVYYVYL